MNKTILITGGAGFVGSNFAVYYKKKYPNYDIICLDNLKRRGSELNLNRLKKLNIQFIHGDIRNKEDLKFSKKIDYILECSAEPSVLTGLDGSPEYVINSNLTGAINCLELARKHNSKFIFLSSSRVYPYDILSKIKFTKQESRIAWDEKEYDKYTGLSKKGISESFPLEGIRSIYGATKLSAEHFINEYGEAFDLNFVINRCGVIAGPWQMGKVDQGIFALWVIRHHFKKDLSYIGFNGEGLQVRDAIHIEDLCRLIEMQINNFDKCNKKTYNVGGGNKCSTSLLEMTKICENLTGNKINFKKIKENRKADIPIFITDNSKIENDYDWKIEKTIQDILKDIHTWIKENEEAIKTNLL